MLKAGIVDGLPGPGYECILKHPGLKITGCFYSNGNSPGNKYYIPGNIPVLSLDLLYNNSDIIFLNNSGIKNPEILKKALKQSKHVMLLDSELMSAGTIEELIKLKEEIQTVFKIKQKERSLPVLNAALPMVNHPSLIDIKLKQTGETDNQRYGSFRRNIYRMLDVLLLLSPLNIKRILALRQPLKNQKNNYLSSRIEFENGTLANLLLSGISKHKSFDVEVYQYDRYLKIDLLAQKLEIDKITGSNNEIKSESMLFDVMNGLSIVDELEEFIGLIRSGNNYSKDLFESFRIAEISSEILRRSGSHIDCQPY